MAYLAATSERVSFAAFAEESSIPIASVCEPSDPSKEYRVVFDLPDENWQTLKIQAQTALAFLERWESELRVFQATLEPEAFWLKFVLLSRLDEVWIQNDFLPSELIQIAGRLGLGIEMCTQSKDSISDL